MMESSGCTYFYQHVVTSLQISIDKYPLLDSPDLRNIHNVKPVDRTYRSRFNPFLLHFTEQRQCLTHLPWNSKRKFDLSLLLTRIKTSQCYIHTSLPIMHNHICVYFLVQIQSRPASTVKNLNCFVHLQTSPVHTASNTPRWLEILQDNQRARILNIRKGKKYSALPDHCVVGLNRTRNT